MARRSMLAAAAIGFVLGFLGSVPVAGPVSAVVVAQGLAGRFRSGASIALGAALGESLYALGVFWGLSELLARYAFVVPLSQAVAAAILLGLGIRFVRGRLAAGPARPEEARAAPFALGFGLAALNPTLIATWTAAVAALCSTGLVLLSSERAPFFAAGVGAGIAAWFAVLLAVMRRYGRRLPRVALDRCVRALGLLLLGLAAWFALRFILWAAAALSVPS
ncbi:MAG: LysE family transporter [Deltaproteobacteria bacterium]|nr:LysE family transporter [Deltaproteobacteria bacterium]